MTLSHNTLNNYLGLYYSNRVGDFLYITKVEELRDDKKATTIVADCTSINFKNRVAIPMNKRKFRINPDYPGLFTVFNPMQYYVKAKVNKDIMTMIESEDPETRTIGFDLLKEHHELLIRQRDD